MKNIKQDNREIKISKEELERSKMVSHFITKMFRDTFFSTYDWIVKLNEKQPIPTSIFREWSDKFCKANDEMRKQLCDYYNLPNLK